MKRKIGKVLAFIMLIMAFNITVQAREVQGRAVWSVEAFTLGGGYLIEPTYVDIYEGENGAEMLVRLLEENGYTCLYTGTVEEGFYLGALYGDKVEKVVENPAPPQEILNFCGYLDSYIPHYDDNGNYGLSACDFSYMSGWMVMQNDRFAEVGFSDMTISDGDVLRLQFSVCGYGTDLGQDSWGGTALYKSAGRDELYKVIAETGYENVSDEDKEIVENIKSSQEEIDAVTARLTTPQNKTTTDDIKAINNGIISWAKGESGKLIDGEFLTSVGTTATDWLAADFARYGVSDENYSDYLNAARIYIEGKYEKYGYLDRTKVTEWHRMALAILACGGDPTYFGISRYGDANTGIDLIADGIYGRTNPTRQGINGPAWALITLGSVGFEVPEDSSYSREYFIEYIMSKQTADLGFALSGSADPDITSMAILALSPYYDSERKYKANGGEKTVKTVIDEALTTLSIMQTENGDFKSWGTANLESTSWVLTALCSLGIDCEKDARFIKNGNTVIDGMLKYRHGSGGFMHTFDEDPENPSATGTVNTMATEQAFYALQSYLNIREGKRHFFDFRPEKNNISSDSGININQPWVGEKTAIFEIVSQEEISLDVTAEIYRNNTLVKSQTKTLTISRGRGDYTVDLSGFLTEVYDRIDFRINKGSNTIAEYSRDILKTGNNISKSKDITIIQPMLGNRSAKIMLSLSKNGDINIAFATYSGNKLTGVNTEKISLPCGTSVFDIDMPENSGFDSAKIIITDENYAPISKQTVRYN